MKADGSDQGLGFAGLRMMVSDISEELALADRLHSRGQGPPPVATTTSENAPRRARSSRANWPLILIVGGGAIAVVLWLNSSGNSSYSPNNAATYPTYAPQPDSGYAQTTPPPVSAYPPADTSLPPAAPLAPYAQGEVRPEIAQGATLNRNQIEYCLAENIRIETSQPLVDNSSDDQIGRFNATVDDYNSRCSSFRYLESEMSAARAAIEARRSAIQQEGASRFP
jgi:hypothetical protein